MKTFYEAWDGQRFNDYDEAKTYEDKLNTFCLFTISGTPTTEKRYAFYVYCPTTASVQNFNDTFGRDEEERLPDEDGGFFELARDGESAMRLLPQQMINAMRPDKSSL